MPLQSVFVAKIKSVGAFFNIHHFLICSIVVSHAPRRFSSRSYVAVTFLSAAECIIPKMSG